MKRYTYLNTELGKAYNSTSMAIVYLDLIYIHSNKLFLFCFIFFWGGDALLIIAMNICWNDLSNNKVRTLGFKFRHFSNP